MYHLILPLIWRGVVGYPKSLKEAVEIVALVDIVVIAEHAEEDALAEAARADEEEEVVGVLHPLNKYRFVNVIFTLLSDLFEVGNAVGEQFDFIHIAKFCANLCNKTGMCKFVVKNVR